MSLGGKRIPPSRLSPITPFLVGETIVVDQVVKGRLGSDEPTALAPPSGVEPASGLQQSRSSTDAEVLQPCPFCGGEAVFDECLDPAGHWGAMCVACLTRSDVFYTTKDLAATVWNTRFAGCRAASAPLRSIQAAIDAEEGTSVTFGCFHADDGTRRYSVSSLLANRSHRYGSGANLEEAYQVYRFARPVFPASERAVAAPLVSGAVGASRDAHPGAGQ